MKRFKIVAFLTSIFIICSGMATTAQVAPIQIAQLSGQCRAANRRIDVFSERRVNSNVLLTLEANNSVTLADDGTNGWIAVSAPTSGFVIARYLKPCTGSVPTPPPDNNLCRVAKTGLAVRPRPVAGAEPRAGAVATGQQVTITGETQEDNAGRTWFKISQPAAGWISGSRGGASNLDSCP